MNISNNQLTLSSDYFNSIATDTFRELWNDQDFADVTLATMDNHQIKAHTVILSLSPFFRNMFFTAIHLSIYLPSMLFVSLKGTFSLRLIFVSLKETFFRLACYLLV